MNLFMYHASRFVTRVVAKLLFGYRTYGREHFPKTGPVLIVANHASFLDPPLVGTSSPRQVRFLARATLANHRLLGWWMKSVGTLLIDRDAPSHRALEAGIEVLRAGGAFTVFPEGTRSPTGAVGEFKRGMLLLLKQTGATVIPCGLIGTHACWPRDRKRPRLRSPVAVRFGAPFTAESVLAKGGLETLRARVAELAGVPLVESLPTPRYPPPGTSGLGSGATSADASRSSSPVPGVVPGEECPTPGQQGTANTAPAQPEQQPGGPAALSSRLRSDGVRPAG